MRFDKESGQLTFATGSIGPNLDRNAFLATSFGRSSEFDGANDGWVRLRFNLESDVGAVAYFKDDRLKHVDFSFRIPADADNAWTHKGEELRKTKHDDWLRAELGEPPYKFSWGEVISEIDIKTGDSSIFVTYE